MCDQNGFGVSLPFEIAPHPCLIGSHLSGTDVQHEPGHVARAGTSGGEEGKVNPIGHRRTGKAGPQSAVAQGDGCEQTRQQTPSSRRAGIYSFNIFSTDICAGVIDNAPDC